MADARAVVRQALLDARSKKEISVYGNAMKGAGAAAKILPHGLILKAMDTIDKIKQNR